MLVMFVAALVRIVIVMVVFDHTNGGISRMVVVARVCRRSDATAHEVLSSERDEHHQ